jgi:hypothetical protein
MMRRRCRKIACYTDLIDVFEELEIPWQHWFMILDADGKVAPDLAEAFHLGQ